MSTAAAATPTRDRLEFGIYLRRNAWLVGLWVLLAVMLLVTWMLQPDFGPAGITALALASLAVGFAAAGQAIAVLTGGIDLSIASMIAVASVAAARGMEGASDEVAVLVVLLSSPPASRWAPSTASWSSRPECRTSS